MLSIYSFHPQVTGREQDLTGKQSPVACRESGNVRVFPFDPGIRYKSDLVGLAGGASRPLWGLHGRVAGKVTTFHFNQPFPKCVVPPRLVRIASCCGGC